MNHFKMKNELARKEYNYYTYYTRRLEKAKHINVEVIVRSPDKKKKKLIKKKGIRLRKV